MKLRLKAGQIAIMTGVVVGGFHLCWSLLVAAGLGQPMINFVLWMHFIKPIYIIEPFEFTRAVLLLIITSGIGSLIGLFAALIWNRLQSRQALRD